MGAHYSALLLINPPPGMEIADFLDDLVGRKHEVAVGERQHPGLPLGDCIGVCKHKNITFIQGKVLFGMKDESTFLRHLQRLSAEGNLFHWTVEDTSGTLAFDYFERGNPRRSWWSCDGSISSSKGTPLAGEAPGKFAERLSAEELSGIEEWDVVAVAEGFGFSWDELVETPFSVYRPTGSEKPYGPSGSQKPWWRFW